jgi:Fe-S-cluster containining protein
MASEFICKRCGLCCLTTDHVDISVKDINMWKKAGRDDLFSEEMMVEWDYFGSSGLFRNQKSMRCPFLRKVRNKNEYYCKIQVIKPHFCREFPKDKEHSKKWINCPGYD